MERIDRGRGVAVLVDGKALALGLRVRRSVARALPEADVRLARGPDDLADQVHGMLAHRPALLLCLGGDRAAARLLDTLHRAVRLLGTLEHPTVGLIAPAGNRWSRSFGASDPEALVARLPSLARALPTRPCRLLAVGSHVGPLAGAGVAPLELLGRLGAGRAAVELELTDLSGEAEEVGPAAAGPGPRGLLYRGPFLGGGAATVPRFGAGLLPFPLAGRDRGRMHLRLLSMPPGPAVRDLSQALRGDVPRPWRDFLARRVGLVFSRPVPVRFGGEAAGTLERVELGLAGEVPLVDWRAALAAA